jgi:hypothetical protein
MWVRSPGAIKKKHSGDFTRVEKKATYDTLGAQAAVLLNSLSWMLLLEGLQAEVVVLQAVEEPQKVAVDVLAEEERKDQGVRVDNAA